MEKVPILVINIAKWLQKQINVIIDVFNSGNISLVAIQLRSFSL